MSAVYYSLFYNYQLDLDDEGLLLAAAADIRNLRFPFSDYFSYAPFSYFVLAGMFEILGDGVITERVMLMLFLLMSGQLTLYVGRRFLHPSWALAAAALYAVAPGPWYKVYFVWCMLVMTAGAIAYLERPGRVRALVFGLLIGLAASFRFEAGMIGAALALGMHVLLLIDRLRSRGGTNRPNELVLVALVALGAALPLAGWALIYAAWGKLDGALDLFASGILGNVGGVMAEAGILSPFVPLQLLVHPTLPQAVYAAGLIASLGIALAALPDLFSADATARARAIRILTLAAAALGSMSYAYLFVWNSRILSTFAIVYIAYLMAIGQFAGWLGRRRGQAMGRWTGAIGLGALALCVAAFAKQLDFYSGSIFTRFPSMATVDLPLLRGLHVYRGQVEDLVRLKEELASSPPGATLVSMSESTTMGYLSGLPDPTPYRLFLAEFAVPGAQQKAIETFERKKITFFVARRSQFVAGGGEGSHLSAYAPKVRGYLQANYDVVPLGRNFVLLRRRAEG